MTHVLVAHRGVSELYPENTRCAFEAAVACGADAIECDIQLTADNQVVLSHNHVLDQYGHPEADITKMTLAELQTLDIGRSFDQHCSGERLMTLDVLLREFAPRIPLYVEFKTSHLQSDQIETLMDRFLQMTGDATVQRQLHGLCFNREVLNRLRPMAKWLPLVWNTNRPHEIQHKELAECSWLHAVGCRIVWLNERSAGMIHNAGMELFSFTCNEPNDVLKASELNVDSIISDNPMRTRHVLMSASDSLPASDAWSVSSVGQMQNDAVPVADQPPDRL